MNHEEIRLPRKLTTELLHLAQISPNNEICGLIAISDGQLTRCYPVANVATQPATRFELDPKQQIAVMARMRENGEDLFAIYHSHPSAPAEPSTSDIEMATYPNAVYLIISLNTKGVLEIRGFKIVDKQVSELTLVMTE